MKNRLIASSAIFSLVLVSALSLSIQAQTTEESTGPSEQPSAPMEMGQPQAPQPPPPGPPPQSQPPQPGNLLNSARKLSPVDHRARAQQELTRVSAASA